ncbi:hypothetical protein ES703_67474 [subsurface metagenome]
MPNRADEMTTFHIQAVSAIQVWSPFAAGLLDPIRYPQAAALPESTWQRYWWMKCFYPHMIARDPKLREIQRMVDEFDERERCEGEE